MHAASYTMKMKTINETPFHISIRKGLQNTDNYK